VGAHGKSRGSKTERKNRVFPYIKGGVYYVPTIRIVFLSIYYIKRDRIQSKSQIEISAYDDM
jgi:hypothetical protein